MDFRVAVGDCPQRFPVAGIAHLDKRFRGGVPDLQGVVRVAHRVEQCGNGLAPSKASQAGGGRHTIV